MVQSKIFWRNSSFKMVKILKVLSILRVEEVNLLRKLCMRTCSSFTVFVSDSSYLFGAFQGGFELQGPGCQVVERKHLSFTWLLSKNSLGEKYPCFTLPGCQGHASLPQRPLLCMVLFLGGTEGEWLHFVVGAPDGSLNWNHLTLLCFLSAFYTVVDPLVQYIK